MSFNIAAISNTISAILAGLIAYRGFVVWKKQKENKVSETFFKTIFLLFLYTISRAIASLFFFNSPTILTFAYVLSHVFEDTGLAHMAKLPFMVFFNIGLAKIAFIVTLILSAIDILLNISFPNQPSFDSKLNTINWGTNKYVSIYNSLLFTLVILINIILFTRNALKNRHNPLIRTRSLAIAASLLICILILGPRSFFETPFLIIISNVSMILAFAVILWGVNFPGKKVE